MTARDPRTQKTLELMRCEAFAGLDAETLARICERAEETHIPAGQSFMHQHTGLPTIGDRALRDHRIAVAPYLYTGQPVVHNVARF